MEIIGGILLGGVAIIVIIALIREIFHNKKKKNSDIQERKFYKNETMLKGKHPPGP